ncbi:MAG: DUF2357 domain-containing protein [Planctomycetaceae bacterium]
MTASRPVLFVFERGHETSATQVWPVSETNEATITESRDYIFELRGVEDVWTVELLLDDIPAEALRPPSPHIARWRWSPGYYSGGVDVSIKTRGMPTVRFELVTDPDTRKLTRRSFEIMIRDLLEDTLALFALSSHRFGIARGTGHSPPIARLEFLRSRLSEMERVIHRISERPVRTLSQSERWVPLQSAKGLTGIELEKSLRNGNVAGMVPRRNRAPGASRLALPNRVRKSIRIVDVNVREHQQIKSALRVWRDWTAAVGDRIDKQAGDDPELRNSRQAWARRCRSMSRRISDLLDLPLFEEVADRPGPVLISSVFRRSPAYSEFFMLYRDFNLGIAQIAGDFLLMPLARTFDLYELWCFFRILRAAATKFDIGKEAIDHVFQPTGNGGITIPASFVEITLGKGFALAFQREYREYWIEEDGRGSFSRKMRPDISLTASSSSTFLVVLDAKYRVEQQLNDAIGDIHTYRDALVEAASEGGIQRIVSAAYILSPFVAAAVGDWKGTELRNRLFHPAYRTSFKFGAATLRPGMSVAEVWNVLEQVLVDAGVPLPDEAPNIG